MMTIVGVVGGVVQKGCVEMQQFMIVVAVLKVLLDAQKRNESVSECYSTHLGREMLICTCVLDVNKQF